MLYNVQARLQILSMVLLTFQTVTAMANSSVSEDAIRQSYHHHAASAQLYRWYQYYENNAVGIDNQLDILAEDFSVDSPSGSVTSRNQYETAVKQFPASWQNAHKVNETKVTVNDDSTLTLDAQITYSNIGIAADNAISAKRLAYQAILSYTDGILPQFNKMTISSSGAAEARQFNDTYAENRLKSLVHYWLAIVEHPGRNAEPLKEILASKFDIKFTDDGDIFSSFDDIAAWVSGPISSISASRHIAHDFTHLKLGEGHYEMSVNFDWTGIRPDGKIMTAKTRHTWYVVDNPAERFGRIQKVRVEYLQPFTVVD